MSFFNWFSRKSKPPVVAPDKNGASLVRDIDGLSSPLRNKSIALPPDRPATDPVNRSEERKLKRHARREQLYQAVRQSFTHAGVLSATYRFKVLSLDQAGNQFMVMVDVEQSFDHRAEKLADIAAKIVQTAKVHYEIHVTSVYWRISLSAASSTGKAVAPRTTQLASTQRHDATGPASSSTSKPRYEPIEDEEVAAFKQALAAASANSPPPIDAAGKTRSNPRSYTLLTGFEDTEMHESASIPALSATQYGDLN